MVLLFFFLESTKIEAFYLLILQGGASGSQAYAANSVHEAII